MAPRRGAGVIGLPPLAGGAVVTVGTFDGVHLGHRAVIAEVVRRARARKAASVVVTFEPHPLAVLHPERAPGRLTVAVEREAALAETELDYLVVLRFDGGLARLEPGEFVDRILLGGCRMVELVVGHDHGFGRGRSGDVELLKRLGQARGFDVVEVAPVHHGRGGIVSSSAVRAAVAAGDFEAARQALGRPYRVSGVVERGDQRGRTLGVPTANLAIPVGKLLPPDGVYAVRVEHAGGVAVGMMNQGMRPTIGDGRRWLEAHLFDFAGDLYGATLRIEWVAWLRGSRPFASLGELKEQLGCDAADARARLMA